LADEPGELAPDMFDTSMESIALPAVGRLVQEFVY
jgi:hypothetical protein